ncbi:MAG: PadR family transcriptional regulator [Anaerolineales bacterium]
MTQKDPENTTLELRRGVITLAILSQLRDEHYGYSLIKLLNEKGLEIDQGTVYPLLRRLQDNGLLDSEWNVEGARPRRYYQISADGLKVLEALQIEWNKLVKVMKGMLS